jgi:uncharacterized protein involved in type VI secretion and phage assembly
MSSTQKYFGKYRGMVINNVDPLQTARLMVQVPDVAGLVPGSWAMPCLPFTGPQMGFWALPQIGAGVWVEFEQGDPDYPIWSGCWYGSAAEPPALALAAPPGVPNVVLQTQGQNTFMLSDVPGPTGGILLKSTTGALISISATGIIISNGQGATIAMTGPTILMNAGALSVT